MTHNAIMYGAPPVFDPQWPVQEVKRQDYYELPPELVKPIPPGGVIDPELVAVHLIMDAIKTFPKETRRRVLDYVRARMLPDAEEPTGG